jgi:hypothetical protein
MHVRQASGALCASLGSANGTKVEYMHGQVDRPVVRPVTTCYSHVDALDAALSSLPRTIGSGIHPLSGLVLHAMNLR